MTGSSSAEQSSVIRWLDVTRQKDDTWRAILPTGARLTIQPAAWR